MKIISNSSKFIADEIKEPSVKHKNINKTDLVEVSLLNYTALNITIEVSQLMSSVATLDKDGEDLVMKIKSNAGKFIADEIKESSVKHKIIDRSDVVEVSLLNYTEP